MFNILALRYVRVEILLTCEKYFHDPIISLREEFWVHTCSTHFIKRRVLGP
jgi:hypothetical protein